MEFDDGGGGAIGGVPKSHATKFRERTVGESYCVEPGCEYNGQPAVQGHCHTRLDDETDRYIARIEKIAEDVLAHERERHVGEGEGYTARLEALYVCSWMNHEFALDELVRLRRDNAALKLRVAQLTNAPASPERSEGDR